MQLRSVARKQKKLIALIKKLISIGLSVIGAMALVFMASAFVWGIEKPTMFLKIIGLMLGSVGGMMVVAYGVYAAIVSLIKNK